MVEFEFRQHDGRMYLPKELQKVIQGNDVKAIANYRAALIFDASVSYEDVERSMKIIFDDIRHWIESSNRSTPRAEKPAQSRSPRRKPATQSGRAELAT
jgi:hypothetical protein